MADYTFIIRKLRSLKSFNEKYGIAKQNPDLIAKLLEEPSSKLNTMENMFREFQAIARANKLLKRADFQKIYSYMENIFISPLEKEHKNLDHEIYVNPNNKEEKFEKYLEYINEKYLRMLNNIIAFLNSLETLSLNIPESELLRNFLYKYMERRDFVPLAINYSKYVKSEDKVPPLEEMKYLNRELNSTNKMEGKVKRFAELRKLLSNKAIDIINSSGYFSSYVLFINAEILKNYSPFREKSFLFIYGESDEINIIKQDLENMFSYLNGLNKILLDHLVMLNKPKKRDCNPLLREAQIIVNKIRNRGEEMLDPTFIENFKEFIKQRGSYNLKRLESNYQKVY